MNEPKGESRDQDGPNFEGHGGGGEHRTVGSHRAWCHLCQEWCYPGDPCGQEKCCTEHVSKDVSVDPVVLTMAVRYCLGRSSYAPGLVRSQVLTAGNLGDQLEIMIRDIGEWLAEDWHDHPCEETWREFLDRLRRRSATTRDAP